MADYESFGDSSGICCSHLFVSRIPQPYLSIAIADSRCTAGKASVWRSLLNPLAKGACVDPIRSGCSVSLVGFPFLKCFWSHAVGNRLVIQGLLEMRLLTGDLLQILRTCQLCCTYHYNNWLSGQHASICQKIFSQQRCKKHTIPTTLTPIFVVGSLR